MKDETCPLRYYTLKQADKLTKEIGNKNLLVDCYVMEILH